ncbi:hypothetical protein [Legionella sp. CNM-4043-24]|uniref:hypothetical protein n=1 Tax=Legionella sp. CNM-4043-24 TaxID=3421646 RepID=UPI00403AC915
MSYTPRIDPLYLKSALHSTLETANSSVENSVDVLFDMGCNEKLNAEDLAFLRTTRLDEIVFECFDEPKFRITNKNNGLGLDFSDRNATRGELRSEVLRNKLTQLSKESPDLSLYDGINTLLRSANESGDIQYFLSSLLNFQGLLARVDIGEQFAHRLLSEIQAGRVNKDTSVEQLNAIYCKLPLIIKHRARAIFSPLLRDMQTKIERLNTEAGKYPADSSQRIAYIRASAAATHLKNEINYALDELIPDKSAFNRCVNNAIKATESTLAKHRGWKQFFARLACAAVSVGTLGIANLVSYALNQTPTFFRVKTESKKLVDELKDIKENVTRNII